MRLGSYKPKTAEEAAPDHISHATHTTRVSARDNLNWPATVSMAIAWPIAPAAKRTTQGFVDTVTAVILVSSLASRLLSDALRPRNNRMLPMKHFNPDLNTGRYLTGRAGLTGALNLRQMNRQAVGTPMISSHGCSKNESSPSMDPYTMAFLQLLSPRCCFSRLIIRTNRYICTSILRVGV